MAPAGSLGKALQLPRTLAEARLLVIRDAGFTLTSLAARFERDLSLVSKVVAGKKRSRPLERKIARVLGLRVHEVFPEWYGRVKRAA